MAGRHRASRHRPSYSAVKARGIKSHARRRESFGSSLRLFLAPLSPSWKPVGGWPAAPRPGAGRQERVDVFGGMMVRYPGATYKSASAGVNRRFGHYT